MINTLVVGTGRRSRHFLESIRFKDSEHRIVGLVDDDQSHAKGNLEDYELIGGLDDIPEIIRKNAVEEVVVITPRSWLTNGKIDKIVKHCETQGCRCSIAMDLFSPRIAKIKMQNLGGVPMATYDSAPDKRLPLFLKRSLDIFVSAAALFVLSPVLVLIAIAVKLTSPGPVFFRQERCGFHGTHFSMLKFRTMVQDAEARLAEVRAKNEMKGPAFKMTNDPRVTRLGKFLRKFSLDELPQLWNVLKGEMSLVGPRPPLPRERDKYHYWHQRRLSMRPGLTCFWQIMGRNQIIDFDEWMKLDLKYIDNWSLWTDVKILFSTVPAVLFAKGAS